MRLTPISSCRRKVWSSARIFALTDLKGTLQFMADRMFGKGRQIRFRPSYFQFTEPSVKVDVSCHICGGKGCRGLRRHRLDRSARRQGWCIRTCRKWRALTRRNVSGFAFGVGIERVAMLKYGVDDIRNFYINDTRFLKMFDRFD